MMKQKWLYFGVLTALFLLVLFSFGSGFWGGEQSGRHWTEKLFYGVCHQMPDRTFTFNSLPMAVNTRCFGIFFGLFAGWITIPLSYKLTLKKTWPVKLLLFVLILQVIDFTGNYFQLWENTNLSRALLGFLLGAGASLSIGDLFYNNNN
jgi:uncharacterized membrane protein